MEDIKQKEDLVDVNLDLDVKLDLDMDLTTDKDELETIRFESVPEKKQTNTPVPIHTTECISFSWIFSCFL